MMFTVSLAKLVLRGLKTETRLRVKPDQRRGPYIPGHRYAVQRPPTDQERRDGFTGKVKTLEDVRVVVTDVSTALLHELDDEAAKREGFPNRFEFAYFWMSRYGTNWPPTEEILCPRCDGHAEVDGETCPYCEIGVQQAAIAVDDDTIWERFIDRHGDTLAWVVRFELEQDTLRLLAPSSRPHGTELGYVTEPWDAMSDEPEAIDPARIHRDWKTRSRAHHQASMRSTDGARLAGLRSDEDRLQELRRIAAERKVDVRDDVNAIRRRMKAMEQKIRDKTDGRAA